MRAPAGRRFACLLALALFGAGAGPACGARDEDQPVGVVRHFLELMERGASDDGALEEAYALLDRGARQALQARAERARSLSGRPFSPWQMLAKGRFRLRFAPASRGGLRARIDGERAVVVAVGHGPGERAEIPLVREGGEWRIVLVLPPLRSDSADGRQDAE